MHLNGVFEFFRRISAPLRFKDRSKYPPLGSHKRDIPKTLASKADEQVLDGQHALYTQIRLDEERYWDRGPGYFTGTAEEMGVHSEARQRWRREWLEYLEQAQASLNAENTSLSPAANSLPMNAFPTPLPWESHNLKPPYFPPGSTQTGLYPRIALHRWRKYKYDCLLDKFSIRLLVIEPGPIDAPLRCQLQSASLNNPGQYEAISYVWGNERSLGVAIGNEGILPVTRNLENALRRVRLLDRPRVVWADAVCINQQDKQERGDQVKLMQKIYSSSVRVLVWLGRGWQESAKAAFALVETIYLVARNETSPKEAGLPLPDEREWTPVRDLFHCAWFWRLWVIQEIASAPAGLVLWGDQEIEWTKIGVASGWLRATGYEIMRHGYMYGVYNTRLMYGIVEETRMRRTPTSFIGLMMLTRQFQCTDDRDRVYSLLGLPYREKEIEGRPWSIEPDYTRTAEQIYWEVAQKCLLQKEQLTVLSAVHHGPELDGTDKPYLPSWVPRWESNFIHRLVPEGPKYNASLELFNPRTLQMEDHIRWRSSSPNALWLEGFEFDTISSVSQTFGEGRFDLWETIIITWTNLIKPLQQHIDAVSANIFNLDFHEALTGGKDWYGLLTDPKETFKHFFSYCRSHSSNQLDSREMLCCLEETFTTQKLERSGGDWEYFYEAARNCCIGRKVFITAKRCIGIGPAAMRPNDIVCILKGGLVPLILRRSGEHYRFAGESYVPGIMMGEAVRKWKVKGDFMEVFEIR